jgi:hypothetical protein
MADNKIDALSILKGLISKAYKMEDGKIAEIFDAENATNDSIAAALIAEDAVRVSSLKKQNADNKDSFNQGYAKATKEQRTAFEKEIKEALGVDSENTGIDLINEVIAAKAPAGDKGAATLTDEDVKKHSVYQTMERNFKKQLKETTEAKVAEIEKLQNDYKANETFYSVRDKAGVILQGLNPILAKNPKVAATIQNQFFNELKGYGFEQQADGSLLPTKESKVQTDAHGHTITFDDLVKNTAENYFEFQANNGGGNAGNENKGSAQGGGSAAKTFKSDKEAAEYANDSNVPIADRMAAMTAYNAGKAAE